MPKKLYTNKRISGQTIPTRVDSKNKVSTTSKYIPIILATFFILAGLLLLKIITHNGFIPDWDESNHLLMSYYYHEAFNSKSLNVIGELFAKSNTIYPPLYHILTSVSFRMVHSWPMAAIITNIPFILILMLSVYGIGNYLGNKKAGFLAAILIPMLPIFLTVQEKAAIDYISASVFICSFYLLFKTEYFTNRKYSILFGIAIFAGFLIKWPFVIPSLPFIAYAVASLLKRRGKTRIVIINLCIALIIILPSLSWYILNYNDIVTKLGFFWKPDGFAQILWANPHGFSIDNILLYLIKYPTEESGIGIVALIMFFASLLVPKKNNKEYYLIASIAITYIVLTYLDDKSSLYMAYVYPLIILITVSGLMRIKNTVIKKIGILLFTTAIIANFIMAQFNHTKWRQIFVKIPTFNKILLLPNYNTKFMHGDWPTEEIVDYISNNNVCRDSILVFPDRRFLNPPTINFLLISRGLNFTTHPGYGFYNPATDKNFDLNVLNNYKCIITSTGDSGVFANISAINSVTNYLEDNSNYSKTKFVTPEKNMVFLFNKRD